MANNTILFLTYSLAHQQFKYFLFSPQLSRQREKHKYKQKGPNKIPVFLFQ